MPLGPDRPELWLRLAISVGGLALIGVLLALQGLPDGPGLIEVVGVAGAFFVLSGGRSALRLWRGRRHS